VRWPTTRAATVPTVRPRCSGALGRLAGS
jgi:hypothetical protein